MYRATNLAMGQSVALKFLHAAHVGDDTTVERFRREARSSSQLRHPNTIRVHDFGEEGAELYMAMELLEGQRLTDVIRGSGPQPPKRSVRIAKQICKSLAEALEQGLVHRDLKPDNVFLVDLVGETDFVKVLDFGISKTLDGTGRSLTRTGMIIGTPSYMAPEQANPAHGPIDHRSDLYAVGVILFKMLTGRAPFVGDTPVEVLLQVATADVPDITTVAPGRIPPALAKVVMRLLSKRPDDRYSDASEVAEALEAALRAPVDDGSEATMRMRRPPIPSSEHTEVVTRGLSDSARVIVPPTESQLSRIEPGVGDGVAPVGKADGFPWKAILWVVLAITVIALGMRFT